MATFELSDDSVVVIVGSGAGGGTLGNELAQKGIKVVMLEAGKQESIDSFQNDEWGSFLQISWLDKRTTSGSWRVARDFAGLPAWICKTVGGTTTHWAGASLRIQEHEFKARTTYGDIAGRQPARLAGDAGRARALLRQGRGQDGRDPHQRHPRPARQQQLQGALHRRQAARATRRSTPATWRSTASRAPTGRPASRSASASRAASPRPSGRRSTPRSRRPWRPASSSCGPECTVLQIQHDDAGKVTGVLYADKDGKQQVQKARVVCVAGNSIESPRLLLNSASAKFPDGLANSSGQVGRNYMRHMTGSVYAAFDKPVHMFRGTTMAGIIQDEAEQRPEARLRRRLRDGDAVARPAVHGGVPRPRRLGPRVHPQDGDLPQHGRHVAGRRGHAAGEQPGHAARDREGHSTACRSPTCTSTTTPTTSPCAAMPSGRARRSTRRPAPPRSTRRRPIPAPTISAPTG